MRIKILFFIASLFFTKFATALQYPIPVFNNIKTGYDNGRWWITVNVPTLIEGGGYGAASPTYSYAVVALQKSNGWEPVAPGAIKKKPNESRSVLFMRLYRVQGANSSNPLSSFFLAKHLLDEDPSNQCVTYITYANLISAVDAGPCRYAPPVPAQCNITTNEIILDHKTILQKEVEDSKAESNFKIKCSRKGTVKFSLDNGGNTIALGEGTSTISINDLPLKSNIEVNNGDNTLKIRSDLHGVKPGTWQGSAVLKFEPF